MRHISFVGGLVIATLVAAVPAYAQESGNRERQRWPSGAQTPRDGGGQGARRDGARAAAPRPEGRREAAAPSDGSSAFFAQRQAQPRGGRPRGDNPRTGTAVPRGNVRGDDRGDRGPRDRGRTVIVQPRVNRYYYAGPRNYAYGYGAFGLGYGYYDPFYYDSYYYGGPYGYGGGYRGAAYAYEFGRLRLDVRPRDAEVYIDGDYVGRVDDFDGRLQGLTLETGGYSVEIVAPGLEPLTFDVRITPGRTTTYRGDLLTQRP